MSIPTKLEKVPKGKNYLHYWFLNSNMNLQNMSGDFQLNKQELLKKQLKTFRSKRTKAANRSGIPEAGKILDGSAFKEKGGIAPIMTADLNMPETMEEVNAALAQVDVFADAAGTFTELVKNQVSPLFGGQDLISAFGKAVIEEYVETKNISASQAAAQVISDLLSRNNEQIFTTKGEGDLPKVLKKISTMVAALPEALSGGTLSGSMVVNNSRGGSTTVSGEDQIVSALLGKYRTWIGEALRVGGEAAAGMAFTKLMQEFTSKLEGVNAAFRQVGGKNVNIKVSEDAAVKQLYTAANATQKSKKVSKSDVIIQVGTDSVSIDVGLNVKTPDKALTADTQKISINIHKGGSLLTFIQREAGLAGMNLRYLTQVVAGHGDTFGVYSDGQLDAYWNDLMRTVKYRGLISALAGISPQEYGYYIAISGNVWTIDDFVTHIMNSASSVNMQEYVASDKIAQGGLDRGNYAARNQWIGRNRANTILALQRSQNAFSAVAGLLQSTKIRIDINLVEIATLFGR